MFNDELVPIPVALLIISWGTTNFTSAHVKRNISYPRGKFMSVQTERVVHKENFL